MTPEQTAKCERCERLCVVAPSANPQGRPMRRAQVPKGMCPNCILTWFLQSPPLNALLTDPAMLRLPHVQTQVGNILRAGQSDLSLQEVDWDIVIANWALPMKQRGYQLWATE